MSLSAETATPDPEQAGGDPSALADAGHGDTDAGGTPQGTPQAGDPGPEAAIELLGQETYDSVKDDPAKLARALHRSYTQKMQSLSGRSDFIEAFEQDPEGTLAKFAKGMGYGVQKLQTDATAAAAAKLTEMVGEDGVAALKPYIEALVDAKVADVRQGQEALQAEAANEAANALIERFEAKYPDFKQFEKKMEEIGSLFVPNIHAGKAIDEFQYMEYLYQLAKGSAAVGDKVEEHSQRVAASARAASRPAAGVSASRVAPAPGGKMSFDDVWKAGRKGEAYDPDDLMAAKREEWRQQKQTKKGR